MKVGQNEKKGQKAGKHTIHNNHKMQIWNLSGYLMSKDFFYFLQKLKCILSVFSIFFSLILFFTSFPSSSCASDSTAHRQWTVRQPEKQTPQSPPGRPRWCPGPSWFCRPLRGPSETVLRRERDGRESTRKRKKSGHVWGLKLYTFAVSHLEEVGQLVLHQLPELAPTERAASAVLGCIAVEHRDEWLHGCLQFWRHGCCSVFRLQRQRQSCWRCWPIAPVLLTGHFGGVWSTYQETVPLVALSKEVDWISCKATEMIISV